MFSLQGGTYSYCTTLQNIVRDRENSEVMWLGDDSSLNAIEENKNQPDILTKPLSQDKFHRIRNRMLDDDLQACATAICIQTDEHPRIDMVNAVGPKKKEAHHLDPSYVYLDTCSTL